MSLTSRVITKTYVARVRSEKLSVGEPTARNTSCILGLKRSPVPHT